MDGVCSTFGGELCTGLWWGKLRKRGHFEDLGVNEGIIYKWTFKKWMRAWTGLNWLRIGTLGGLLSMP
jgi:hypothetical protein